MHINIERRMAAGFGMVVCIALFIIWSSFRVGIRYNELSGMIDRTQVVLLQIEHTRSALGESIADKYRYVLTEDTIYLAHRELTLADLNRSLDRLQQLTADDPLEQVNSRRLRQQVAERLRLSAAIIALHQSKRPAAVQRIIESGQGVRVSQAIEQTLNAMEQAEKRLLKQRQAAFNLFSRQKQRLYQRLRQLALAILLFVYADVRRTNKLKREALEHLHQNALAMQKAMTFQRAILDSANYTIISTDPDGTIRTFNRAAQRMLGYTAEEVIGNVTPAIIHDGDETARRAEALTRELGRPVAAGFEAIVAKSLCGIPDENEWTYIRKDGSRFPVLLSVTALFDAEGKLNGFLGVGSDITERKAAEETIRQSEARLQAVVNTAVDGIVSINEKGLIQSFNPAAERIFGYRMDEVIRKNISTVLPEPFLDTRDGDPANHLPASEEKTTGISREVIGLRKDGTLFPLDLAVSSVQQGQERLFVGILRDNTERMQAETALRESQQRLSQTIESIHLGLWEWNIVTGKVKLDPGWLAILGYEPGDLPECLETWERTLHPEEKERVNAILQAHLKDPNNVYEADHRAQTKSGAYIWVMTRGSVVEWNHRGRPTRMIGTLQNIADRKAAEGKLRASEARLAESQRIARLGSYEYAFATGEIVWTEETYRLFDRDLALGPPTVEEVMDYYHPSDRERLLAARQQAFQDGKPYECDLRIRQRDGSYRWCRSVTKPVRDEDGTPLRVVGTLLDIHERKQAEEKIHALNTAMEQATEGIAYLNAEGHYLYVNDAYALLSGSCAEEMIGRHWLTTIPPEAQPAALAVHQRMKDEGKATTETQGIRQDGSRYFKEVAIVRDLDMEGRFQGWYVFAKDISERRQFLEQIEAQMDLVKQTNSQLESQRIELEETNAKLEEVNRHLEELATTDGLTRLKNHRAFQERLAEEFHRAERYETPLSILLLDVDKFKQYNDTFGHPAGDQILKRVGHLLQATVRDTDMAARYGGEEFVAILPQTDLEGALEAAERIRQTISEQEWEQRAITVSIGVATMHRRTENPAALIAEADKALYVSKSEGRNRVTHSSILESAAPIPDKPAT